MSSLHQQQKLFTDYLRNPTTKTAPCHGKVAVYQDLVFNNINGLLTANFPVIHSLLVGQAWLDLVRAFIIHHVAKTPYFSKIAGEFVRFLMDNPVYSHPAFLTELADYEYRETLIFTAKIQEADKRKPTMVTSASRIALASTTELHQYSYPVHKISTDFIPKQPSDHPHFLVLCRDETLQVRFTVCNALSFSLLQQLQRHAGLSVGEVTQHFFQSINAQAPHLTADHLLKHALAFLHTLNTLGALIHTCPPSYPQQPLLAERAST